ncbi:type 1 glutamine amidotransferase [Acidobacteriota bacterium]
MRIYVVDLSLKQIAFAMFEIAFHGRGESIYVPGFQPPYPEIDRQDIVVLTGSEYSIHDDFDWLEPLMAWVRNAIGAGNPVLGVCYGHQLIIRALTGREDLGRSKTPEMTYVPIEILKDHAVFDGVTSPFLGASAHYDEVSNVPEGFDVVAGSEDCPVQGIVHKEQKIVGFQFHPEFEPDFMKKCIVAEKEKLQGFGFNIDDLIARVPDDPTDAVKILPNFLDYCMLG